MRTRPITPDGRLEARGRALRAPLRRRSARSGRFEPQSTHRPPLAGAAEALSGALSASGVGPGRELRAKTRRRPPSGSLVAEEGACLTLP